MFRIAALFVSAALLTPLPLHAQASEPQRSAAETALLEAESRRVAAQVSRDLPTLDREIAAEAVYIHANGQTQGRADYLRDVEAGTSRYRAIDLAERTVRLYRGTAVTHGRITLHVGTDRTIAGRYTGVYAKRGGRWQVVSWQTTPEQPRS